MSCQVGIGVDRVSEKKKNMSFWMVFTRKGHGGHLKRLAALLC